MRKQCEDGGRRIDGRRETGDRRRETGDGDEDGRQETGERGRGMGDGGRKTGDGMYKFQRLEVYKLALEYVNAVYDLSRRLPESERFNLRSQVERAATSIVLNIAEGSTGQTDTEQRRFLGLALRLYLETVACWDLIERRSYLTSKDSVAIRDAGHNLFVKLQALRKSLQ